MKLEQQLSEVFREERKRYSRMHHGKRRTWATLSVEEKVFAKQYYHILSRRKSYVARAAEARQLLKESLYELTPRVHAYIVAISEPFTAYLEGRASTKKLAHRLKHDVCGLEMLADRALRQQIGKLHRQNVSFDKRLGAANDRIAELEELVERIPGFEKLVKNHISLKNRYATQRHHVQELEHKLKQRVLRTRYQTMHEEYQDTLKAYQGLRRDYKALSMSYARIGYDLVEEKRYRLGVQIYQKALDYAPERAAKLQGIINYNIGLAHGKQKHYKTALQSFQQAQELLPKDKEVAKSIKICERELKESA